MAVSKRAISSGGLGDLVYAIPTLKALDVREVLVKQSYYFPPYENLYVAIKRFLMDQGFDILPYPNTELYEYDPGIAFDYDLDTFRRQPHRGRNHIMVSYMNQFHVKIPYWQRPWLHVTKEIMLRPLPQKYNLIHLTDRWREGSKVDWTRVLHRLKEQKTEVCFVGFQHEWTDFCTRYGNCTWLPTSDVLDLAAVVMGAEAVYCNQSVVLALAQGFGKTYYLEPKPRKTNCLLYTPNENILK